MERLFSKKDLKKLYVPILIEILLTVSVGVADTMMVSQAGETAVSGSFLIPTKRTNWQKGKSPRFIPLPLLWTMNTLIPYLLPSSLPSM